MSSIRPSNKNRAAKLMEEPRRLKRLTIELDEDLHKKIKGLAAQNGISIKEFVHECLYKCINV